MKYLLTSVVLLATVLFFALQASGQEVYVEWPIEEGIVYESGARLVRSGSFRLNDQGRGTLVIGGLAERIDESMVQVNLSENWSLVSRLFRRATSPDKLSAANVLILSLEEELKSNRRTLAMRDALLQAYTEELSMIQANRKVGGDELLLVEDLVEHADFWRKRVKELKYLMLELELEMDELAQARVYIDKKLLESNEQRVTTEGQLVLQLSGPINGQSEIKVDYIARDARWMPVYDASVQADGAISLKRFAKVQQSTKNAWDGVPLTFTVGRPTQSLAPPEIAAQTLTLIPSQSTHAYELAPAAQNRKDGSLMQESPRLLSAEGVSTQAMGALERYEFIPANTALVAGSGKPERIFIDEFSLSGKLAYLALPEASDEAYQLVSATNWSRQRLLPGSVNILTDGIYRGAFQMKLPTPGDTLRLPLGQDARVRCSRQRLIDQCSSTAFGGSRKTTQSFELKVENQHNRAIELSIEDRVPISNTSDIEVEVEELAGGKLDAATGKITWDLMMGPLEKRTIVFSYTITFPKRHALLGL
tara:strand:+ start:217 stop:1821 length:1605 start_codon:yes stop_codon:yes gene_type:complete